MECQTTIQKNRWRSERNISTDLAVIGLKAPVKICLGGLRETEGNRLDASPAENRTWYLANKKPKRCRLSASKIVWRR
jgi:hypothetical protein